MTTSKHFCTRLFLFGSALLLAFAVIAEGQSNIEFEAPPVLHAHDLASPRLLNGSGFHVDDAVPTDGLIATFTIHTDVGTLKAPGLEMLKIRPQISRLFFAAGSFDIHDNAHTFWH